MNSGRLIRIIAMSSLILASMGAVGAAWAQVPLVTGVTGTLLAGGSLLVTGSSFGQKVVAAPLKWDDFESGTPGAIVGNGWARSAAANSPGTPHYPDYSTSVLRPNSTRSMRARFDEATAPSGCPPEDGCQYSSSFGLSGNSKETGYTPGLTLPVIYLDTWLYYAPSTPFPRNVKPFRVHTNTYTPNLYLGFWCPADADVGILSQDGMTGSCYNPPYICGWFPTSPDRRSDTFWAGHWRHIQVYLVESTPGVADGTAIMTSDGVTNVSRVHNFATRNTSAEHWDTIWLGNYMGHGSDANCAASPGNSYAYWDDAYVDTTQAHVEIGDASTYSACTHREIQIPTLWTPTSIAIKANPGSFASLTNTYLFVVDRNGTVNSTGYKLAASGTGDVIGPNAVGDLRPKTGP